MKCENKDCIDGMIWDKYIHDENYDSTCPDCKGTGKQPETFAPDIDVANKQQSTSDEIREAFELQHKDILILDKGSEGQYINRDTFFDFCYYESGYTTALNKAQEEIEQWEKDYSSLKTYSEELEQQIETMKTDKCSCKEKGERREVG